MFFQGIVHIIIIYMYMYVCTYNKLIHVCILLYRGGTSPKKEKALHCLSTFVPPPRFKVMQIRKRKKRKKKKKKVCIVLVTGSTFSMFHLFALRFWGAFFLCSSPLLFHFLKFFFFFYTFYI